jgi:hypothetical protein
MYRSVDVMGGVDFLCIVRLMLWVWWIFYVPFVDVLGGVDFYVSFG